MCRQDIIGSEMVDWIVFHLMAGKAGDSLLCVSVSGVEYRWMASYLPSLYSYHCHFYIFSVFSGAKFYLKHKWIWNLVADIDFLW